MSVRYTKQQLCEILKAASVGSQPSDMGPGSPDDEPSTSGLGQQEKDVAGLQSKVVKQAIESPVPQRQISADGNICLDLESGARNLSNIRPDDWNCWTEGNNSDALFTDSSAVPVDLVRSMVPNRRESFCKAFFSSLCDWMKRIAAGFGLTPQESVSGWYKHCWDTLGTDALDQHHGFGLDSNPKPIATSTPMRANNSKIAP
ncbi:uncharacterized protein [Drosophila pseudoobscura]|uniref:Uncharacterized protein n=1 Tax=Drosophila pseudoobscura pseudoobscura TaxID=46245 RepID=A0A6I8VH23_DROPS|nr:uncharacterized protein LOC26533425 [Drosophila pseudoobscura]